MGRLMTSRVDGQRRRVSLRTEEGETLMRPVLASLSEAVGQLHETITGSGSGAGKLDIRQIARSEHAGLLITANSWESG